ncbi:hypothetical protein CBL_09918 [Carabus blaptoides fortunei]
MNMNKLYVFERVEVITGELQKKELSVNESHTKVDIVRQSFNTLRKNGFAEIWHVAESGAENLELEPPTIPRLRKAPRRLETDSSPHVFTSPRKYYEKLFYEVLDLTLSTLCDRFQSDTIEFLNNVEDFIIKKPNSSLNSVTLFYNISDEKEFNPERLKLHRDMLVDTMLCKSSKGRTCVMEVQNSQNFAGSFSLFQPQLVHQNDLLPRYGD